jgi:hypothetical protein
MSAMPNTAPDQKVPAANRRRAMLTAAVLGLVALGFYVGIFFLVHYRHP